MAKNYNLEKCIFFDKRHFSFMSFTAIFRDSKCAGLQTNDAIELESCKPI